MLCSAIDIQIVCVMVCSFGAWPERRGHVIEEMYADGGGQF
jgi:hypothetical protein